MTPTADFDARRLELAAHEQLLHGVEPLQAFIARMRPALSPTPWHLQRVTDLFERSRHRPVYATIAMPPRAGKTTTISLGLAWRIVYDPACLNFYATFGDRLSKQTSRLVRRLVREAGAPLSAEAQDVHDWRSLVNGGLRATTVGGEITGAGCNGGMVVADDMIKGRRMAESKLERDKAWDYLRDDLMSRLETGASLIVNATRWHYDDPIGRLMHDGLGLNWEHVVLPAVRGLDGLAADEESDPDARALWPEAGYDLAWARSVRKRGEYGWWSLYQQQPVPRDGGMFKRKWFEIVDPADVPQDGVVVRRWDLAASTSETADYTACVKMRRTKIGVFYIEHVMEFRGSPHDVDAKIRKTAEQDGADVRIGIPQDPGQAGLAQKAHLARLLDGFTIEWVRESGSKKLRAEPFASQAEGNNVRLVRGPWNDAFLDHIERFPAGKHDDQTDAASGAHQMLITRLGADRASVMPRIVG